MHLDLTDEETFALLNLLTETVENDRYPLSPRIQNLRSILAKFGPIAPLPPPPARPPTRRSATRADAGAITAALGNRPRQQQLAYQLGSLSERR